jgi:hypothetical protein
MGEEVFDDQEVFDESQAILSFLCQKFEEKMELSEKIKVDRKRNQLLLEKEREMEQKIFEKEWFDNDSSYSFSEWIETRKKNEEVTAEVERDQEEVTMEKVERDQKKYELSDIRTDIHVLMKGESDVDTPHFGYCKMCFTLLELFRFLEKYSEVMRFEKVFVGFYRCIREKLKEFSHVLQDMSRTSCKCDEKNYEIGGSIVRNILRVHETTLGPEYMGMENYCGYGLEREKYRMCKLNFFVVDVVDEEGDEFYYITRDFEQTRDEILHWLKYFEHEHEAVVEEAIEELEKYIPDDCIGVIEQFL